MSRITPEYVKALENAAETSLSSEAGLSHQERQEAEDVLLSFRRSNPSLQDCRIILEQTSNDPVQYQAAVALKETIIRQWHQISDPDKNALKDFILNLVLSHEELAGFVREALAQILAVIAKLSSLNSKDMSFRESLNQVLTNLVSDGTLEQQLIACSILSSLLVEFAVNKKSSDMGITLPQHWQSKAEFENYEMLYIFNLTTAALKLVIGSDQAVVVEKYHLLMKLVQMLEQLLSWTFTSSVGIFRVSVFTVSDRDEVRLRVPAGWAAFIMNSNTINLIFAVNDICRGNEGLSKFSLSCISQLATLEGPIIKGKKRTHFFLDLFLKNFIRSYGDAKIFDYEALGVANVCYNLTSNFEGNMWLMDEMRGNFEQFLNLQTALTCVVMKKAAQEEFLFDDDHIYMESFEIFLTSWTTLSCYIPPKNELLIAKASIIFEHYVKFHIVPPDGWRPMTPDDHEFEEIEEDDRQRFKSQLISVAVLARLCISSSFPAIISLFQQRISLLQEKLHMIQVQSEVDATSLENLFEDLHWLIMIIGCMVADDCQGEMAMIPEEIMDLSISHNQTVDKELYLQLLASPGSYNEVVAHYPNNLDPSIQVISLMFNLCLTIQEASRVNMIEQLSPEVVSDVSVFLCSWAKSYLFFKEEYYDEISPILSLCFGIDSPCSEFCIGFIAKFACSVLQTWVAEQELLTLISDLLYALVDDDRRCSIVARCEEFWNLGHGICAADQLYKNHPPKIKGCVMTSVVIVGTSNMNLYKDKYWDQTMNLVRSRYQSVTEHMGHIQSKNAQLENELLLILDLYCGVADGVNNQNSDIIFNFLSHALSDGAKIIETCHGNQNIILSVLELFFTIVKQGICQLSETNCQSLYGWILSLLESFSIVTRNFVSREAEEESFQDLTIIMKILFELCNKELLDVEDEEVHSRLELSSAEKVDVAEVVLRGLTIILPHMNTTLLSYPTLCLEYYNLIQCICEAFPEKVEQLPETTFKAFMCSLQLGLTSYGIDVCKLCLESVTLLFDHVTIPNSHSLLKDSLTPFIKLVFDVIVVHASEMELLRSGAAAFYKVFRFNPDSVRQLLTLLVDNQNDQNNKDVLVSELNKLSIETDPNSYSTKERSEFIHCLEDVIFKIRCIICVK